MALKRSRQNFPALLLAGISTHKCYPVIIDPENSKLI